MKAGVAAFNQEKALVGAFSVIANLRMELFGALVTMVYHAPPPHMAGAKFMLGQVLGMITVEHPRPAPPAVAVLSYVTIIGLKLSKLIG